VFARGAGLTQACGSGACAAMVAARRRGLVDDRARLILDGGELEISWAGDGPVTMTGPTARVFEGRLAPELFADAG
jgi:diaminopimelate epimerase